MLSTKHGYITICRCKACCCCYTEALKAVGELLQTILLCLIGPESRCCPVLPNGSGSGAAPVVEYNRGYDEATISSQSTQSVEIAGTPRYENVQSVEVTEL